MGKGKLERFELTVNEQIFVEGEWLYDNGAVLSINKGENNLFTADVQDKDIVLEVEILNPASLKRRSSCECKIFQKHKICPHIVAVLLAVRKKITPEKSPKRSPKKSRKKTDNQFNTRNLVELLDENELRSFVREYARKDRMFDLSLKARFSKKMEMDDNTIKIKAILDALVPLARNSDYRITKSSVQRINKILEEFCVQIEDSMALQKYTEAFELFSPSFRKIAYVRHYTRYEDPGLQDLDNKYHKILTKLLESGAAPELLEQIILDALSLASFSYYSIRNFRENILMSVYQHDSSHSAEIKSIIVNHLQRSFDSIVLALFLFFHKEQLDEIDFAAYYNDQHILAKALQILLDEEEDNIAAMALAKINKLNWQTSVFEELFLDILSRQEKYNDLVEYGMQKLVQTQRYYYFRVMLKGLPDQESGILFKTLEKEQANLNDDLKCRIYHAINEVGELLKIILKQEDVLLAMRYDLPLFDLYPDEITSFYLERVEKYLDDHVGFEANKHVDSIIEHLSVIGAKDCMKQLKNLLINKFPHRKRFLTSYK